MKVAKSCYIKYCKRINSLLTVTEKRVLNEVTTDNWFDPVEYLRKMEPTGVYVTERQKHIMFNLPRKDDGPFEAESRNIYLEMYVEKARILNGAK